MKVKKIKLYRPHEGQKKMHFSKARYRIASCGRRFGKTYMAANEIVKHAWENPNHACWWVAPTYQQARIAFDLIKRHWPKLAVNINRSELFIEFPNGGRIDFKSADRPDNLRGFGLHFLVIDEAAFVAEETWNDVLRPALADKKGRLVAIGTPKGKNWFYHLWVRGQDSQYPDYESWKFPTHMNPYIPKEELEELKRTLPERVYKQEILAEFLEESGGVFRNVQRCVKRYELPAEPAGSVFLGVDLAKYEDFTVLVAVDTTGKVIYFDRFNQLDWGVQKSRIVDVTQKYNARVIVDSTGVGDPIFEDLRRSGLDVEGYKFTNTTKENLINNLSIKIERQEVTFPNIPELINELSIYQYEITKNGHVRMNAPPGYHDDCVIALALAIWGMDDYEEIFFERL